MHLLPIWQALPEDVRGPFCARGRAFRYLKNKGVEVFEGVPRREPLVCVASFEDYRSCANAQVILVNHGVGQTYFGDKKGANNPSYSGGRNRERVVLFVEPSQRAATATLTEQPGARVVVAGCPKMDPWHLRKGWRPEGEPVVAVTFHADVHVVPETRWAFPYYRDALRDVARSGQVRLLGHGHPRNAHYLHRTFWKFLDIPFTYDFDEVLEQASCLVADNSSVLYEFASTDRPVVTLSAPWYRRDVDHGLRFWSAIPGIHIEESEQLSDGIAQALWDPPHLARAREEAVQQAYEGFDDGQATCRTVEAIVDYLHG